MAAMRTKPPFAAVAKSITMLTQHSVRRAGSGSSLRLRACLAAALIADIPISWQTGLSSFVTKSKKRKTPFSNVDSAVSCFAKIRA
jgi:hypothetical protein|tara:strand:- start:352 stop:609 length:258 start_codon:yes stop_codon:yes gene_type:complete